MRCWRRSWGTAVAGERPRLDLAIITRVGIAAVTIGGVLPHNMTMRSNSLHQTNASSDRLPDCAKIARWQECIGDG